jgi:hypothetical protein
VNEGPSTSVGGRLRPAGSCSPLRRGGRKYKRPRGTGRLTCIHQEAAAIRPEDREAAAEGSRLPALLASQAGTGPHRAEAEGAGASLSICAPRSDGWDSFRP